MELVQETPTPAKPKRKRGRPAVIGGKRAVKIRLDNDIVDSYRASGPGWQTRINDTLRKALTDKIGGD